MASKIQVLKANHAFSRTIQRGRRVGGQHLTLYYFRRKDRGPVRFGVTTIRSFGKAFERNRMKRQLRAVCRAVVDPVLPGYDIVIMAKAKAKGANYHVLLAEAQRHLQKANILQDS